MRYSLLLRALRLLSGSKNNKIALWDRAEPISLDELKAKFTELARNELACKSDLPTVDSESLTFEELWRIFESLEDLEDYPIIY